MFVPGACCEAADRESALIFYRKLAFIPYSDTSNIVTYHDECAFVSLLSFSRIAKSPPIFFEARCQEF